MKIEVKDLTVRFADNNTFQPITAVQDLSLTVEEGEFVCVVGPSGCGKTTLLRVIAGLERATQGVTQIHGSDTMRPDYAMVFQNAGLFPWMTVLENVAYGMRMQASYLRLLWLSVKEGRLLLDKWREVAGPNRYARALKWIERVGLSKFVDAFPGQLSGGMQQRVGLARAFAHNAEVLLLDEPFGALDAQTRLILQDTLLGLWKSSDMTVLFVTHSIEEALTLADRIVVMSARPGHIIAEFKVDFERPRDVMKLRTTPEFGQKFGEIWEVLREEVLTANQQLY
ncbi:MAG: ABC transporter ATP-binding protein [Chloroflexi bacterium]|nr:ABC transporter ATP-binding protein [Chloroflexota bacterium]